MKEIKVLVIDRDKWLRGAAGRLDGLLLNGRGLMCCLGFAARACGVTPGEMLRKPMPFNLSPRVQRRVGSKMPWLFPPDGASPWSESRAKKALRSISGVNDKKKMPEAKREKEIKAKFAKQGVKVIFKGRTSKATLTALHGERE